MRSRRYATSRQKACQQCVDAKAKCDRRLGGCARCGQRSLACTYPQSSTPRRHTQHTSDHNISSSRTPLSGLNITSANDIETQSPSHESRADGGVIVDPSFGPTGSIFSSPPANTPSTVVGTSRISETSGLDSATKPKTWELIDFTHCQLICPINVDDIKNRWLYPYIPVPGQTAKNYPPGVTTFIYRIFKAYATVAARGRSVPPFVHHVQIAALSSFPPLATCLSLVRIGEKPLAGSEAIAADVLQREMSNLYEQHQTYDDASQLAAFQAYLIYSMVLFFQLGQGSGPVLRQAMINLQEIACLSAQRGLICSAEQQRARPSWEAWIMAEAKRRTLYVMYMFDSVLSAQDGLPTFLGTELRGLPAPASKALWEAKSRRSWETAYNLHLAEWIEEGLHIDELWPVPPEADEEKIANTRSRVDQWLQHIDEFGTMLYAVTSCTHEG